MLIAIADAATDVSWVIDNIKATTAEVKTPALLLFLAENQPAEEAFKSLVEENAEACATFLTFAKATSLPTLENAIREHNAEMIWVFTSRESVYRNMSRAFPFIEVVRMESQPTPAHPWTMLKQQLLNFLHPYIKAIFWSGIGLFLGFLCAPFIGYKTVGSIFLLAILLFSLKNNLGPILLFTFTSCLGWYLFLVPRHLPTYGASSSVEDTIFGFVSFMAGCIIGSLIFQIRRREKYLWEHQQNLRFLYDLTRDIAKAQDLESCMKTIFPKVQSYLYGEVSVILKKDQEMVPFSLERGWWLKDEKWVELAKWSCENEAEAGVSTRTQPSAPALFIPMRGAEGIMGVLSFHPNAKTHISNSVKANLYSIAHQLGLFIERNQFLENFKKSVLLEESERLHQTIFSSLSHELKTPIAALLGYSDLLLDSRMALDEQKKRQIFGEINDNVWRLDQVLSNLLDSSRLHSGRIQMHLDWCDASEILETSTTKHRLLKDKSFACSVNDDLPLIKVDFGLIVHCVENFVTNAVLYGQGKNISVGALQSDTHLSIYVSDEGPGIEGIHTEKIFERFYRVPGSPAGGSGLGLFLVKQIVELHGGSVSYEKNQPQGAKFAMHLPLEAVNESKSAHTHH